MSRPRKRTAEPGKPARYRVRSRLRILVATSLATAAGLETSLRAHPDLDVIVSSLAEAQLENVVRGMEPDVLVLDAVEEANGQDFDFLSPLAELVPVLALATSPPPTWIFGALQAGIRGVLPPEISGDELASAVRALTSGLVVLSREFSETMLPPQAETDSDELDSTAESLTAREQQVLAMLAEGLLNKEIANRLRISEHTVKFHISSIMGKLGASSRTEAVTRGIRRRLIFL